MEEDLEPLDLKQENYKSNFNPCINCDYQETTQGRLKVHQQTDMMGDSCTTCHKTLQNFTNRKRHKENSHYLNGEKSRLVSDCREADIGLDEVLNASLFSSQGEELKTEDLKQENYNQETTQGCLKIHQTKHETCDICDKQLTTNGDITRHKQVTHDFNHFCDKCDIQATQKNNITVHIKAKHDVIRYSCTTCHKTFSNFKRHKENSHYLNGERVRLVSDCREADIVGLDEVLRDASLFSSQYPTDLEEEDLVGLEDA